MDFSIIGQLLGNNWPIMDFLKTFLFQSMFYPSEIKTISPHTLDSTSLMKKHRIIEEKYGRGGAPGLSTYLRIGSNLEIL